MTTPRPRLWFPDTCSLMTMQVHPNVDQAVRSIVGADNCRILEVVCDELDELADYGHEPLAADARKNLGWPVLPTPAAISVDEVRRIQASIAGGRPLERESQHWAESVFVAMAEDVARRATPVDLVFISQDYGARVAAGNVHGASGKSIHRLLKEEVRARRMPANEAVRLADLMHEGGRGDTFTAAEFSSSNVRSLRRTSLAPRDQGSPRQVDCPQPHADSALHRHHAGADRVRA